jgi:hypothetical protein
MEYQILKGECFVHAELLSLFSKSQLSDSITPNLLISPFTMTSQEAQDATNHHVTSHVDIEKQSPASPSAVDPPKSLGAGVRYMNFRQDARISDTLL